ncbi:MAG: hypothetical protein AAB802_01300, partial [Patescibacteria group bacterium]
MKLPSDLEKLRASEWETPPPNGFRDEVNQPIKFDVALKARTSEDVARVLEYAAENHLIVKTGGAITSSGSFTHPEKEWMDAHGKEGAILLTFSDAPDSEFNRIEINEEEATATAGAAVSLQKLRDAVDHQTEGRLVSPMRITTMDARLVATFLGSGGVSDACSDMNSLMAASQWMDGTGRIVKEEYARGTYFDWSCFNRVNKGRIGVEMSGRGGPFGVGLHATTRLREPYVEVNRFVISFLEGDDPEEVHASVLGFIHQLNMGAQSMASGLKFKPVGVEIMDKHSIALAARNGHKLEAIPGNTQTVVILDAAQAFDEKNKGPDEVISWYLENGLMDADLVMDEEKVSFVPLTQCQDVEAAEAFRLAGPDGARRVIKQAFPTST